MSGTTRRVFGVAGLTLLALFLWWATQNFFPHTYTTIDTDLAQFPEVAESVKSDFAQYPLVTISEDYSITDTLKDGVEITYGGATTESDRGESETLRRSFLEEERSDGKGATSGESTTTFTTPDQTQSLSLQFPPTLQEPLVVTLPGNRTFTVTHQVEGEYQRELLTNTAPFPSSLRGGSAADDEATQSPTTDPGLLRFARNDNQPEPQYLKYTSPDARTTTYYAYQKDQAAGYRNLKHWTIFNSGTGEESQSYLFHNAHLKTNDRGEVEVRYFPSASSLREATGGSDEAIQGDVPDDLWTRAQSVLQQDFLDNIENTPPDLTIPPPYTIDANGNKVTHEWTVTTQKDYDPADTSGAYRLSVSFPVPLLGYPIALDPTLQFTAPGVSNAGEVITGEATSNSFGYSLTTADLNADGKDDLAVGAYGYNSNQGRAYLFYGGSMVSESATGADVTLTGEATGNFFGISLTTGDLNADGKDDLAVGAYGYNSNQGRAYLFYGGSMVSESATGADVTLTGEATGNFFGASLTTGDLNADGKDDLAVGAYGYNSNQGRAYLFYGGSMVSESATGADVTLTGEATGNFFGASLTTGDLNADGKDDLAVGAYGYNSNQGRAYLFYGGSMVSESATGADVTLTGEATSNYFGRSLTTADLNADGKDDLVVSAYGYNSNQGRAYLFYGGSMVSESATGADVTLTGEATSNYFGRSLTTADLNADGKDDLVVSAYVYNSFQGRAYLFYGGSMVSESATGADVTLTGEATGNFFGISLTTGDLNNDGKDDLIVGATGYNSSQGRTYIFYSQSGQVNLDKHITGEGTADYFGSAFTTGDFNADGRPDLAVGAYLDNTSTGKVYIFYNDGSYPTGAASADVILTGGATGDYSGFSLTTGDFNYDGKDDIAVGAHGYSSDIGRAYIFYGGAMISEGTAGADITLTGEATSFFGISLATGDLNSDGKDDLIVGADTYASFQGRTYIFYGGSIVSEYASTSDVTLTGETASYFGKSLTIGDFNNDGKEDLAVGTNSYNSLQGRVYIFYNDGSYPATAGTADHIITGISNSEFGRTLTVADLNADGKDDLVVDNGGGDSTGKVYIFYNDGSYPNTADSADSIIVGEAASNYFGTSFTTGDFNHDGRDDLAVGAYGYTTNTGRTYIFYNDGSSFGTVACTTGCLASNADIILTGNSQNDDFGFALATFDYNADGRDDLVVGAPGYTAGGDTGRLYFYETRENYAWEIQRQSLVDGLRVDPLMGYEMKITGEATSNGFGTSIALADLNNDGKDDLIVGASGYNSDQGRVYIFYNDGSYGTKAGRADVTLTGEATGNYFGEEALTIGDFNDDGKEDLVVGALGYNSDQGRAYIFYGGSIISENASGADIILVGETTSNYFGVSHTAGDFNADGKEDIIVGASGYNGDQGRAYIFYGGSIISENASGADIILTGEDSNNSFGLVLTTGDFNADGKDDLAVSASLAASYYGRIHIFYGGSMISENASGDDVSLTGGAAMDFFGTSLVTGDFNTDGKDDIAVSTSYYSTSTGRAYIFYGGSMISESTTGADITLTGGTTSNSFGYFLTTGDFNFDGKDDLVVSANEYDIGSGTDEGRTYIFYGGSFTNENASGADITLTGEATSNYYGSALTTGDLNADGKDDLIVGATGYNSNQGRLYFYTTNDFHVTGSNGGVYLGNALTVADFNADGKQDLAVGSYGYNKTFIFYGGSLSSESDTGADVTLTGETTANYFGASLTTGDYNNDGKDDLAVGAYGYTTNTGRSYLFYGGSMVSESATGADVTFTGETTNNGFGSSLTTGDLNADGKDDLIVCSNGYDVGSNTNEGRAYIFYGGSMISENATGADVTLTGEATGNYFGGSLTTGDLNADGKDDIAVGAYTYSSNTGRAYIFYGGSMISENATGADVILTGEATGNYFGRSLTTGDLNADGQDDLIVGATGYNSNQGRAYIFYGGSMVSESATGADVTLTGETTSTGFGNSLTSGDVNNDGTDDLVVDAYLYNSNQGRVYLFYGGRLHTTSSVYADVVITGEKTSSNFGNTLYCADISGNGVDDIVIGSPNYDVGSNTNEGRVYILSSEAATEHRSQMKIQGTVKMQGTVKFQ